MRMRNCPGCLSPSYWDPLHLSWPQQRSEASCIRLSTLLLRLTDFQYGFELHPCACANAIGSTFSLPLVLRMCNLRLCVKHCLKASNSDYASVCVRVCVSHVCCNADRARCDALSV